MRVMTVTATAALMMIVVPGCGGQDEPWLPDVAAVGDGGVEAGEPDVLEQIDVPVPRDEGQDHGAPDPGEPGADEGQPVNTGLYEDGMFPDLASCEPGQNTEYQKELALDRLNYVRSLHGLPEVWYDDSGDAEVAACSLTCVSKRMLSHYPDENWPCYTQLAADGCGSSNLHLQYGKAPVGYPTAGIVDGFIRDENVDAVGHRRWFLDPWLQKTAFARVDDFQGKYTAASMKVIWKGSGSGSVSMEDGYVAYPFHDYPEALYTDKAHMSFSVIADKSSKWKNGDEYVRFTSPAVTVKDEGGASIGVSDIGYDTQGYGVPNCLWFKAGPTKKGVRYDVTVSGITVNGKPMIYQYWFRRF